MQRLCMFAFAAIFSCAPLLAGAETLNTTSTPSASPSGAVSAPDRGSSMNDVTAKWGEPQSKIAPVGEPPITRWQYGNFTVYFEHEYVIHTVARNRNRS